MNCQRAKKLLTNHNDLDEAFQAGLRRFTTFLLEDARNIGNTMVIVLILKSFERIGDHANNICEYVVFLVQGKDVRHINAIDQLDL